MTCCFKNYITLISSAALPGKSNSASPIFDDMLFRKMTTFVAQIVQFNFTGFFLLNLLKSPAYADKPRTVDALKANSGFEIAAIEPHMCNQVTKNDRKRLAEFDLPGKVAANI